MRSWRSSAAYRIALANFVAFATGLAVLGVIVFAVMHIAFTRQLDAAIAEEAQGLVDEYQSGGDRELAQEISERERAGSAGRMLYAVFSTNGRRIYGSFQAERPATGVHDIAFYDPRGGPDGARGYVVDLSPNERLVVAADDDWLERIDETVIAVFGVAFAAACLLGLVGAAALGRYLRERLQSIGVAAEAIIGGDVRRRIPVSARGDEFDDVAATLNRMLDRIEGLLENLKQLSSDIAHDLRTPLARLRARLEQGATKAAECQSTVIEEAIRQVDDVLSLFGAILRIAEVEAGETRRFFKPVDLSDLITDLAESYSPAFEDCARKLLWSIEPAVVVEGDRELLAQAVINLLENARRHTPALTIIRLALFSAPGLACIQVADTGPGVPTVDLGRITRRFTRVETSRSTAGYGLGLNLVSAVAVLHRGHLELRNTYPGFSAVIELPSEQG
jgi:signal transduction histidine kinase